MLCRRCVLHRATSQRELCVFWEQECFLLFNSTSRLLLTVTLLCWKVSSQCYCVLTRRYFQSLTVFKVGWGKNMPADAHLQHHAHLFMCVRTKPLRQTHKTPGPEQWHATAQDVYVTSCVCEELFGVTVETRCNIEKFPLSLPLWLCPSL